MVGKNWAKWYCPTVKAIINGKLFLGHNIIGTEFIENKFYCNEWLITLSNYDRFYITEEELDYLENRSV